jgi:hypothetical protein
MPNSVPNPLTIMNGVGEKRADVLLGTRCSARSDLIAFRPHFTIVMDLGNETAANAAARNVRRSLPEF